MARNTALISLWIGSVSLNSAFSSESVSVLVEAGKPDTFSSRRGYEVRTGERAGRQATLLFWLVGVLLLADDAAAESLSTTQWPMHIIDNSLVGADGVRPGDVNGDGLVDYVTGWEESGRTRIYLHPGHAAVREPWPYVEFADTPDVEDAFFADLDGDGRLDVIVCCETPTKQVVVFWGPEDPGAIRTSEAWRRQTIPALDGLGGWMYGLAEQIDGEHGVDLILGSKSGKGSTAPAVGWLRAPADPRQLDAWTWHPLQTTQFVRSFVMHDMDADGDRDLVVNDFPDGRSGDWRGLYWLERPADPLKKWRRHDVDNRAAIFFAVGDIDRDGKDELVWGGRDVVVFTPTDDGHWTRLSRPAPEEVVRARSSALADIDGDGLLELVCTGVPHHIWHFKGSLDPALWQLTLIENTIGSKPDRAEIVDLDGDGDLDLLTCEERYRGRGAGVIWHENPLKP